jgi:cytochrome aa3-600 menaquinol oxidase subunit 2
MSQAKFDEWVKEVKETADPLTEDQFNELVKPGHLGQLTFTGTHLEFLPPPTPENGGHDHGGNEEDSESESHETHQQHAN